MDEARSSLVGPTTFLLAVTLALVAAAVPFGLYPLVRVVGARGWSEQVCTIRTSHVAEVEADEGFTYRVAVTYTYERDGVDFVGDRYDFVLAPSPGRDNKERIVHRLPPGTETPCWVHPTRPDEVVLDRSVRAWMLLGTTPLAFAVVLLLALVDARRGGR